MASFQPTTPQYPPSHLQPGLQRPPSSAPPPSTLLNQRPRPPPNPAPNRNMGQLQSGPGAGVGAQAPPPTAGYGTSNPSLGGYTSFPLSPPSVSSNGSAASQYSVAPLSNMSNLGASLPLIPPGTPSSVHSSMTNSSHYSGPPQQPFVPNPGALPPHGAPPAPSHFMNSTPAPQQYGMPPQSTAPSAPSPLKRAVTQTNPPSTGPVPGFKPSPLAKSQTNSKPGNQYIQQAAAPPTVPTNIQNPPLQCRAFDDAVRKRKQAYGERHGVASPWTAGLAATPRDPSKANLTTNEARNAIGAAFEYANNNFTMLKGSVPDIFNAPPPVQQHLVARAKALLDVFDEMFHPQHEYAACSYTSTCTNWWPVSPTDPNPMYQEASKRKEPAVDIVLTFDPGFIQNSRLFQEDVYRVYGQYKAAPQLDRNSKNPAQEEKLDTSIERIINSYKALESRLDSRNAAVLPTIKTWAFDIVHQAFMVQKVRMQQNIADQRQGFKRTLDMFMTEYRTRSDKRTQMYSKQHAFDAAVELINTAYDEFFTLAQGDIPSDWKQRWELENQDLRATRIAARAFFDEKLFDPTINCDRLCRNHLDAMRAAYQAIKSKNIDEMGNLIRTQRNEAALNTARNLADVCRRIENIDAIFCKYYYTRLDKKEQGEFKAEYEKAKRWKPAAEHLSRSLVSMTEWAQPRRASRVPTPKNNAPPTSYYAAPPPPSNYPGRR